MVRNMLVITLLLFGGLYAVSYLPTMLTGSSSEQGYEAEYSYRYLNDADEPSESGISDLAGKYGLTVENYREGDFLRVFGSGTDATQMRIISSSRPTMTDSRSMT